MTLTEKQFNSIVKDVMTDLPFVKWDRATNYTNEDDLKFSTIYGWIEREEDQYKDFVVVRIFEKEEVEEAGVEYIATSSAEYSEEIHQRLFPNDEPEMHNECYRLEDKFDVQNLVKIEDIEGENA